MNACIFQSDSFDLCSAFWDNFPSFLYHISPALVTVLGGSILVQRFFISHANESSLIDDLNSQLNSILEDALEYWNLPCANGDEKQRGKILEQRIKGAIRRLSADLTYYTSRYSRGKQKCLLQLLTNVSDACTNGEFESKKKPVDSGRYLIIVNSVNSIRSELLHQKL